MRRGRRWLLLIVSILLVFAGPVGARDGSLKIDTNRYDATTTNEISYSEQERLFSRLFTTDLTDLIQRHLTREAAPRQAVAPQLFQTSIEATDRTATAREVVFTANQPTQRAERYNHRLATTPTATRPYLWGVLLLSVLLFCGIIYQYYFRPKGDRD